MTIGSPLRFAIALSLALSLGCQYHEWHGCDPDLDVDVDECFGPWCGDERDGDAGAREDAAARPAPGCTATADCAAGEVCVEAACRPIDETCRFDHDCGAGRRCVDNACRPHCTDETDCRDGTACTAGLCEPTDECAADGECAMGERCVERRCLVECAAPGDCGSDAVCGPDGSCRPDVDPRPFCATDAECAAGHLCVLGVCRTPCPTRTDEECLRWDSQLVRCAESDSGPWLCLTHHETSPECATPADCAEGERCADAICVP